MTIGKKFMIKLSLVFIVVGLLLSFAGFASSGFDLNSYTIDQTNWYRVIRFE